MFPNQMSMQSMTGMQPGKKKTRRGNRGGKGRNKNKPVNAHHAQAQEHLAKAAAAPNPNAALGHLFKGLTALNKAKKPSGGMAMAAQDAPPMAAQPQMPQPPQGAPGGMSNA